MARLIFPNIGNLFREAQEWWHSSPAVIYEVTAFFGNGILYYYK